MFKALEYKKAEITSKQNSAAPRAFLVVQCGNPLRCGIVFLVPRPFIVADRVSL